MAYTKKLTEKLQKHVVIAHYKLVVICKRTGFPAVEQTTSTSYRVACDRLRNIFATHQIPERLESDNGPPFNSVDIKEFAEKM